MASRPTRSRRRRGGSWSRSPGIVVRPVECHHWSMATLVGRTQRGRQSDRVHRRDRAGRPDLPLRRHLHLRHAADRRAVQAHRRAARLHAPARASYLIPGPGTFLTGEMDPDEAARAAEMLGLELAVACHYLASNEDVDRFVELVPQVRQHGQAACRRSTRRRDARRRAGQPLDRRKRPVRLVTHAAGDEPDLVCVGRCDRCSCASIRPVSA